MGGIGQQGGPIWLTIALAAPFAIDAVSKML